MTRANLPQAPLEPQWLSIVLSPRHHMGVNFFSNLLALCSLCLSYKLDTLKGKCSIGTWDPTATHPRSETHDHGKISTSLFTSAEGHAKKTRPSLSIPNAGDIPVPFPLVRSGCTFFSVCCAMKEQRPCQPRRSKLGVFITNQGHTLPKSSLSVKPGTKKWTVYIKVNLHSGWGGANA